jgi:hypothetical protein
VNKTYKVYFSGGTVTQWQHEIMGGFVGDELYDLVTFYNPADFTVGPMVYPPPAIYSPMNKQKIDEADIVFAYLEASNPTPINTILEIGYGIGKGKLVIFCNEWSKDKFDSGELKCLKTSMEEATATWFKPHYLAQVKEWVQFYTEDFGIAKIILRKIIEYEHPELVPDHR